MGLTDADGNPIAADDPRLPTPEETAELHGRADALIQAAAQSGVSILPDILDVRSKTDALVATLIPPMEDHPARRVYEHRRAEARLRIVGEVLAEFEAARRGPALTIARDVPQGFPSGLQGK